MLSNVGLSLGNDLGFYFLVVFGAFWLLIALVGLIVSLTMNQKNIRYDSHWYEDTHGLNH